MDVLVAAYQLVSDHPGGAVAIAPLIGKNSAALSHEVNPNYPSAKLGLADAVKLSVWSRDTRILNAFAAQMGCMVLPLPTAAPARNSLEAVSAMACEFADLLKSASMVTADGVVTQNELLGMQRDVGQLFASVQVMVQGMDALARQSGRNPGGRNA